MQKNVHYIICKTTHRSSSTPIQIQTVFNPSTTTPRTKPLANNNHNHLFQQPLRFFKYSPLPKGHDFTSCLNYQNSYRYQKQQEKVKYNDNLWRNKRNNVLGGFGSTLCLVVCYKTFSFLFNKEKYFSTTYVRCVVEMAQVEIN